MVNGHGASDSLTNKEIKFLRRIDKFYKRSTWLICYWGGLFVIMFGAVVYLYLKTRRNDLINIGISADLILMIAFIHTLTLRKIIRIMNKLKNRK